MLIECGFENCGRKNKRANVLKQHEQMMHTSTQKCKLTFEEVHAEGGEDECYIETERGVINTRILNYWNENTVN